MQPYIEISGRQSGKLERIIKAAHAHKGHSVVVLRSEAQAAKLETAYPTIAFTTDFRFNRYVYMRGGHKADKQHNNRYFFYDFDNYNSDMPILKNGYYATTPRKVREETDDLRHDLLLRLVDYAGKHDIKIHNFRNSDFGAEFKKEHRGCTNRDVIYQVQVLGRYLRKQLV